MVMALFRPELFSSAITLRIPLASMSKVTSIWGLARGIGGMSDSVKVPISLFWATRGRSPSNTLISTLDWLSALVEKVLDLVAGMVVFLSMRTCMTPPTVSTPRLRAVTSNKSKPSVCLLLPPVKMCACTAAPNATASSGLMDLFRSLPEKYSEIKDCTLGIRVLPPTSTTSCTAPFSMPASCSTLATGSMHRWIKDEHSCSKRARLIWV
mmetsp:Transcript_9843/g.18607  ORF Transcript_9843/g.18607 Transcript_9843/m.18607 type:complete len:210 (+) Transcript_9843:958-1587(+)